MLSAPGLLEAGVPLVTMVVSVTGQMVVDDSMMEVTTVALSGQSVTDLSHWVTVLMLV